MCERVGERKRMVSFGGKGGSGAGKFSQIPPLFPARAVCCVWNGGRGATGGGRQIARSGQKERGSRPLLWIMFFCSLIGCGGWSVGL